MRRVSHRIRCLITAGPTREHFDPLRFLSNGSSGKMGYALAERAATRGWQVTVVSGPVALPPPPGVTVQRVVSAEEMFRACEPLFMESDLFIAVAAVADYRPRTIASEKLKKTGGAWRLDLVPTVDILKTLAACKRPGQVVVGFAAETDDVVANARKKLAEKDLDLIVANRVGEAGSGFGSATDLAAVVSLDDPDPALVLMSKAELADILLDRIRGLLA